jgi:putative membrane protein
MKYAGWIGVVAVTGLCLWAGPARAQAPSHERLAPAPAASGAPRPRPQFAAEAAATARPLEAHEREARRILKESAAASRFQVDAARLALARSTNAGVRALAGHLATEHQQGGDELLRMLHQRGLAAPMMENAQRKTLAGLARLKGARFDREYAQAAVTGARLQLAECEKAAPLVQDPLLQEWIARALPALRHDIEAAERLAAGWPAAAERPARRASARSARHHWAE